MFTRKPLVGFMATTIGALVLLTGCAAPLPPNRVACAAYEVAYNTMADAARMSNDGGIRSNFVVALDALPTAIGNARKEATGPVEKSMRSSALAAKRYVAEPQNREAGKAFFLTSIDVATKCEAAGEPIKFRSLRNVRSAV